MLWSFIHRLSQVLRPGLTHSVVFKAFFYRMLWMLPEKHREQTPIRTALKQLADRHSIVRFLNIGANDGLSGDPLREFIVTRRWRGVLVEPQDFVFRRLQKAYARYPSVRCENIAISDHKGSAPFWHLRKNTLLPPGYDQIGSFSRDHLLKHADVFPGMEAFITCRQIPCTTIRDLLKKHDMQRVELVFIDTEGYDFEIVKQLDLKDQAPELLIYEEMHLSEADRIACRELLHAAGYSILTAGGDSVAVKVPRPTDEVLKVRS